MTTTVYFIRHAEPNYENHDDFSRELTQKGLQDSQELVNHLNNLVNPIFYSSPFKRSTDTLLPLASFYQKEIQLIPDFRERKITDTWIEDFKTFSMKQWEDFNYKLPGGESLHEVQTRNIQALESILSTHSGETIIIGTHGTALSTIVNYYKPEFNLTEFERIKHLFPFIFLATFEQKKCLSINEFSIN